jgi:hypothetical protein
MRQGARKLSGDGEISLERGSTIPIRFHRIQIIGQACWTAPRPAPNSKLQHTHAHRPNIGLFNVIAAPTCGIPQFCVILRQRYRLGGQ